MGIFGKKTDKWDKERKALYRKLGQFAMIDWTDMDKVIGSHVKKIFIYSGRYIVGERTFNEAEANILKKQMPLVDMTQGRPYAKEFDEPDRRVEPLGRLNLSELSL